jgi:uncharacterized protein (TIGR02466 family)
MKNKEIVVLPLFSQPVATFNLNVNNEKIFNFLKNKIKFKDLKNKHDYSSYISEENKLFNIYKELKELKKECEKNIDIYLKEILKLNIKFKILNSWATKSPFKHYSHVHSHQHNFLSAVYYPSYSKHHRITFERNEGIDTFFNLKPIEYTVFNSKTYTITPGLNTLLIFSSTLRHKIEVNTGQEDRYSIAFCVNPVGKFDEGNDTEIEFV